MVYDAVEHGIGDRFFADYIVPVLDGYLRGYHGRVPLMPVLDDIHQYAARLGIERLHAEVVEDQHVDPLDALKVGQYRAFGLGYFELAHQFGRTGIHYPESVLTGLIPECRRKVTLARSCGSRNDEVLVVAYEPTHE